MKKIVKYLLLIVIIFTLVFYTIHNGFIVFRQIFRDLRFIVQNPSISYDDKMRIYWWGVYDFTQFVKRNTPPDAKIVIPPQDRPWLTSGNNGLMSYFLYPRVLINGSLYGIPENADYDYIAIIPGEWEDAPAEKYGWPKITVHAEKIIYFNPQTKETSFTNGPFYPNQETKAKMGLIKVEKGKKSP